MTNWEARLGREQQALRWEDPLHGVETRSPMRRERRGVAREGFRQRFVPVGAAGALLLALVVAACSGGEEEEAGTASPAATAVRTATQVATGTPQATATEAAARTPQTTATVKAATPTLGPPTQETRTVTIELWPCDARICRYLVPASGTVSVSAAGYQASVDATGTATFIDVPVGTYSFTVANIGAASASTCAASASEDHVAIILDSTCEVVTVPGRPSMSDREANSEV